MEPPMLTGVNPKVKERSNVNSVVVIKPIAGPTKMGVSLEKGNSQAARAMPPKEVIIR